MTCVRIEMVFHTRPGDNRSCWAFEVSDPHTRELVAKWVNPSYTIDEPVAVLTTALTSLEAALRALLDPEPF